MSDRPHKAKNSRGATGSFPQSYSGQATSERHRLMDPSTSRIAESRNSGKSFTLSQQIDRSIVAIERWETEAQQAEDRMRFAQRQANAGRLHLHELEAQIPLGGAQ